MLSRRRRCRIPLAQTAGASSGRRFVRGSSAACPLCSSSSALTLGSRVIAGCGLVGGGLRPGPRADAVSRKAAVVPLACLLLH